MYWKSGVIDRRQCPRLTTTMSAQYRGIRQLGDSIVVAIARDISGSGARLLVNEFISVFTRLVVEIGLPSASRPIRAVSKVAWIRKRPHGEQYEIGMQFVDIPEEDKKSLSAFLERSIPKQ